MQEWRTNDNWQHNDPDLLATDEHHHQDHRSEGIFHHYWSPCLLLLLYDLTEDSMGKMRRIKWHERFEKDSVDTSTDEPVHFLKKWQSKSIAIEWRYAISIITYRDTDNVAIKLGSEWSKSDRWKTILFLFLTVKHAKLEFSDELEGELYFFWRSINIFCWAIMTAGVPLVVGSITM